MSPTTTSKSVSKAKQNRLRKIEQAQSGTARAALLGVSDGLVTNVSLILGVAGAGADASVIRLAGIASLLAGALSMAVGEYISMRGQVEVLASVLDTERAELKNDPEHAKAMLRDIMEHDGMSPGIAATAATEVARDPEKTMAMYARGKLGINPDELGSAWGAAISSLVAFSLGALVPLAPWFVTSGVTGVLASLLVAALAAIAIGAYLGYTTTGSWLRSALRQLAFLIAAAGATYLVGRIFGVALA